MDVAPASYLIDLAVSAAAGVTLEDAQGTLMCNRTGCRHRRVASAGGEVLRAFGISAVIEEVRDTA